MKVDVAISAADAKARRINQRAVAVVDVFRATSVIVEALHNGARRVIPTVSVDEVYELRKKITDEKVILGGERNTVLIAGFDKDNSPLAYGTGVRDASIIFTTTNGTRAIHNSRGAAAVYIASLLNCTAVCEALAAMGLDVTIVCAGREDEFTAEDGLCAGAMVRILQDRYGYEPTDIAGLMERMYRDAGDDLRGRLAGTVHYEDILSRGYEDDIRFCLQRDIYSDVPRYDASTGEIRLTTPKET